MSRSYKKIPILKDGQGSNHRKLEKRNAKRAVKYAKEVANGSAYKKEYNSWNIYDYKWRAEEPVKGGTVWFGRRVSEEEMRKAYRKARQK